jgi:hypothetical protein
VLDYFVPQMVSYKPIKILYVLEVKVTRHGKRTKCEFYSSCMSLGNNDFRCSGSKPKLIAKLVS